MFEPVLLLGSARFANVDIRIRVKGGGFVSQVYGATPLRCLRARFDRSDPVLRDTLLSLQLHYRAISVTFLVTFAYRPILES